MSRNIILYLIFATVIAVPVFAESRDTAVAATDSVVTDSVKTEDADTSEKASAKKADTLSTTAAEDTTVSDSVHKASAEQIEPVISDSSDSIKTAIEATDSTVIDSAESVKPAEALETAEEEEKEKKEEAKDSVDQPATPVEEEEVAISGGAADYRSPRRAMFYSLLIPGAGQYYARSKVRAGFFAAVEIACFAVQYNFRNRGSKKDKEFKDFTDDHYSHSAFMDWYNAATFDEPNNVVAGRINPDSLAHYESYMTERGDKTHNYYEMIYKYNEFVHGWDDATPTLQELIDLNDFYDSTKANLQPPTPYGFSARQDTAAKLSQAANDEYKKAADVWIAILINHLCSAIDAGLTAKRYNRSLLKYEKTSFLDRLHLESKSFSGVGGMRHHVKLKIDF